VSEWEAGGDSAAQIEDVIRDFWNVAARRASRARMRVVNEMTREEIDALLDEQTVGRLGCREGDEIYVVPLIYARRDDALYMMTTEGRKTRAARSTSRVCFEVDEYDRDTGSWRSAIVWGRYEELDGQARDQAIAILSGRLDTRRPSPQAREARVEAERPTVAFRIVIDTASGRFVTRSVTR
jgi:nitroimidazol reductase NimA-like FMN-containing flavoprotein (pyridoxamine 5'-phosphate oxidase superfamily)